MNEEEKFNLTLPQLQLTKFASKKESLTICKHEINSIIFSTKKMKANKKSPKAKTHMLNLDSLVTRVTLKFNLISVFLTAL